MWICEEIEALGQSIDICNFHVLDCYENHTTFSFYMASIDLSGYMMKYLI